ncbi:MAG: ABC transporter ATP-binding protein, partial [Clostridiaceae bacterium]|nr:ABC transporter ATP-binding protein [Clostridiaceae bacterium]
MKHTAHGTVELKAADIPADHERDYEYSVLFEDFTFQYRSQAEPTLHNIDFRVKPGEKVLIVGPSGSGKSTLAHCINGLVPHAFKGNCQGRFEICGEDALEKGIFDISKVVGTVLQDPDGQFVGLSAGEDIAFALENDCIDQEQMKKRVLEVADLVEISNQLHKAPQDLSGGQKQRVSVAGVLVDDVDILLFDEPLANLDPQAGTHAIDLIDRLHKQTDKTIIIIEHRLEDVLFRSVDRIVVFNEGRIIADAPPEQLLSGSLLR